MLTLLLACQPTPLAPDDPMPLDPAIEARVDDALAQLTLDEKAAMTAGGSLFPQQAGWPTQGVPRLGVPALRMTDGPRGVGLADVATVFPVGALRAATWDEAIEEEVGRAMGAEARALGKDVLLAPTLNLVRHPRWGRAQESYGEDPLLLGRMAAAFIRGAETHVAATAKHYAANSIEATRYEVDVQVDERTLREVYLPHFRVAVREGGAGWVMAAYNKVNGEHAAESRHLLTDILKGEWGFQGPVMSDWIWGTTDGALALGAGLDLEMPAVDVMRGIGERVANGEVPMERLDDAARRQLRATFLGERRAPADPSVVRGEAHRDVAYRAALEGMVLLQNGGALPLAAGARVAVVGALADVANTGDHGSSDVPYEGVVTPLAGLAARLDVTPVLTDTPDADQLAAIGAADAAIVVVGLTWEDEGEGIVPGGPTDRADLALPGAELIRAVATSQPRTIVVLEGSGPMWVEDVVDRVDALVMAWYPGQEGGRALADLLLGDADFTGRLPVVWPAAEDQLPPFDGASLQVTYGPLHGWRWMEAQGETPRFPFGFGLSYAACSVDEADVEGWPAATITGRAPGCPVVFAWADDGDGRRLAGFTRPAASGAFTMTIDPHTLATWDDGWSVGRGPWTLEIGVVGDTIRRRPRP